MIEEQPKTKVWYDDFPVSSKLLNVECPSGFWAKCLFIPEIVLGCLCTICIDIVFCWIILSLLRCIKWLAKEILEVFVKSFLAKVLAISAFAIFGFLVFVLIKSGTWEKLYDFCTNALQ